MHRLKELIIELSANCNLACSMCGYGRQPYSSSKFMKKELFQLILDKFGGNSEIIRLNGRGESTLHPEFISMLSYTKERFPNANINLFTNLCFNNKVLLDSFLASDMQLFVSIDSPNSDELHKIRVKSSYTLITQNLDYLRQAKRRPFLVFTLQPANAHRIIDISKFANLYNLGLIYNTVRYDQGMENVIEFFRNKKDQLISDFKAALEIYKNKISSIHIPQSIAGIDINSSYSKTYGQADKCPAALNELCVLYNGDITPCNMFNPYVYTNIAKLNGNNIDELHSFSSFQLKRESDPYCKNCACIGATS